jgi:1,4-dihydroxy-6-naphthoate synthase
MRLLGPEATSDGRPVKKTPKAPVSLSLAYSPSIKDTYLHAAWSNGLLPGVPRVRTTMENLETLNTAAIASRYEVTKTSYATAALVTGDYRVLRSGSTIIVGNGPILIGRPDPSGALPTLDNLPADARIAIPGSLSTAYLLLRLALGREPIISVMRHDRVVGAVARGEVDFGIAIDEARIAVAGSGLGPVVDLAEWWRQETGGPLPLAATMVRRDVPLDTARAVRDTIRASLAFAREHGLRIAPFVRGYSHETDPAALYEHLGDTVNEYTNDVGEDGAAAVAELFARAADAGLIPARVQPEFV